VDSGLKNLGMPVSLGGEAPRRGGAACVSAGYSIQFDARPLAPARVSCGGRIHAMKPNPSLLRAVLTCTAILLGGCALFEEIYKVQAIENWAKDNEPLAESGRIRWSQFYAQYLEKVAAVPAVDQGWVSERLGILAAAARLYEEGRLDKAAFDSIRSIVRTYRSIDDPAANTLARAALVGALRERGTAPAPDR
jgi:hypothetical protein